MCQIGVGSPLKHQQVCHLQTQLLKMLLKDKNVTQPLGRHPFVGMSCGSKYYREFI